MVARYSDEYTSGLPSDYNGRYVKYDDYEELENEQERLRLEAGCMQATIDALTRKGIELQDELFRVKNESLKIVPMGEPIEHKANPECYCLFGGHVVDDSFFSVSTNEFMMGLNRDTIVQPVRLQPWGENNEQ